MVLSRIKMEVKIMNLLEVKNLKKVYTSLGMNKTEALKDINFSVEKGEFIAIMGESGSGKTTLLNILASLDKASSGEVYLEGKLINNIKDKDLATFRRDNLGFVFQEFNLLDTFNLKDNILLPLVLANNNYKDMNAKLNPLARKLGIFELLSKYPYEVSGGQKQRVAVCRALINDPKLVLADEPTGALDSKSTDELLKAFVDINKMGQTILMVTHSIKAASIADRVLFIKDGKIFHEIYKGNDTNNEFYEKISNTLTLLVLKEKENENL